MRGLRTSLSRQALPSTGPVQMPIPERPSFKTPSEGSERSPFTNYSAAETRLPTNLKVLHLLAKIATLDGLSTKSPRKGRSSGHSKHRSGRLSAPRNLLNLLRHCSRTIRSIHRPHSVRLSDRHFSTSLRTAQGPTTNIRIVVRRCNATRHSPKIFHTVSGGGRAISLSARCQGTAWNSLDIISP